MGCVAFAHWQLCCGLCCCWRWGGDWARLGNLHPTMPLNGEWGEMSCFESPKVPRTLPGDCGSRISVTLWLLVPYPHTVPGLVACPLAGRQNTAGIFPRAAKTNTNCFVVGVRQTQCLNLPWRPKILVSWPGTSPFRVQGGPAPPHCPTEPSLLRATRGPTSSSNKGRASSRLLGGRYF